MMGRKRVRRAGRLTGGLHTRMVISRTRLAMTKTVFWFVVSWTACGMLAYHLQPSLQDLLSADLIGPTSFDPASLIPTADIFSEGLATLQELAGVAAPFAKKIEDRVRVEIEATHRNELDALRDDGAARSWLITILRREYARTFERKVPKLVDIDAVPVPETGAPGPDRRAERDLLREAIAQLPPRYREPLLLQVVIGLSGAEIAQALNISQSAVMTRLFRAREKLMARVQRDGITGNIDGPF